MSIRDKLFENSGDMPASKILHVSDFNQNIPNLKELVHALNIFINSVNPYGDRQDVFEKCTTQNGRVHEITFDSGVNARFYYANNNNKAIHFISNKEEKRNPPYFRAEFTFHRTNAAYMLADDRNISLVKVYISDSILLMIEDKDNNLSLDFDMSNDYFHNNKCISPLAARESDVDNFIKIINKASKIIKENILDKIQIQPAKHPESQTASQWNNTVGNM